MQYRSIERGPNGSQIAWLPPQQKRVCDAMTGTVQRMAMRIVDVPSEERAETYERVRLHYLTAAAEIEPNNELTHRWVETTVAAIKRLVAAFDSIGCGHA